MGDSKLLVGICPSDVHISADFPWTGRVLQDIPCLVSARFEREMEAVRLLLLPPNTDKY